MKYRAMPLTNRDAFLVRRDDGATRLITALQVVEAGGTREALAAAFARPPASDLDSGDKPRTIDFRHA